MRLLNEKKYTLSDNNKMLQVVDRVEAIYHREQAHRGTQMIFTDLGTPRPNQFSIYQELKDLLVAWYPRRRDCIHSRRQYEKS